MNRAEMTMVSFRRRLLLLGFLTAALAGGGVAAPSPPPPPPPPPPTVKKQWPLLEMGLDPFEDDPLVHRTLVGGIRLANFDRFVLHREYYDAPQVFATKGRADANVPLELKKLRPDAQFMMYQLIGREDRGIVEGNPQIWFRNSAGQPFVWPDGHHYPDISHPNYVARMTQAILRYVRDGGNLGAVKPLNGWHNDDGTYWKSRLDGASPVPTEADLLRARQSQTMGWRLIRQNVESFAAKPFNFDVESEDMNWPKFKIPHDEDPYWGVATAPHGTLFASVLVQDDKMCEYVRRMFDQLHAAGRHMKFVDDAGRANTSLGRWAYCFYLCFSDGEDIFGMYPVADIALERPGDQSSKVVYLQPLGPATKVNDHRWKREFDKATVEVDFWGGNWAYTRK